jgi:hypothetical protein
MNSRKGEGKVALRSRSRDKLVHFSKTARGIRTNNFVFYDGVSLDQKAMNTKLDVTMVFDATNIESLLKAFLRLPNQDFSRLIHPQNDRGGYVDFHGAPRASELSAMKAAKPTIYSSYTDGDGDKYHFFEIGVYVCLRNNGNGNAVFNSRERKASIEVKFARDGVENNRMVVNIHLVQGAGGSVADGVAKLDALVSDFSDEEPRINPLTKKDEARLRVAMTECKKVNAENYASYRYQVHENSTEYFKVVDRGRSVNPNCYFQAVPDVTDAKAFPALGT